MLNNLTNQKLTRRTFLKSASLLAGIAAVPVAFVSKQAFAAKMAKAALQYQDHPKNNLTCSKCMQYIPGKTAAADSTCKDGTCKLVEGAINPNGWCLAFAPKS